MIWNKSGGDAVESATGCNGACGRHGRHYGSYCVVLDEAKPHRNDPWPSPCFWQAVT